MTPPLTVVRGARVGCALAVGTAASMYMVPVAVTMATLLRHITAYEDLRRTNQAQKRRADRAKECV